MADLHIHGSHSGKRSARVDLTPMVDLGFLLITFFIVATTLSTPRTMPLRMPADGDSTLLADHAALTLIASADNKIFYYSGRLEGHHENLPPDLTSYVISSGIGAIIRKKKEELDRIPGLTRNDLVILIKSTPDATYGNVVALIDEMAIDRVSRYALVELTEEEKSWLKEAGKNF